MPRCACAISDRQQQSECADSDDARRARARGTQLNRIKGVSSFRDVVFRRDTGAPEGVSFSARTLFCCCESCISSEGRSAPRCLSTPWVGQRTPGQFVRREAVARLSPTAEWEEVSQAGVDPMRDFAVEVGVSVHDDDGKKFGKLELRARLEEWFRREGRLGGGDAPADDDDDDDAGDDTACAWARVFEVGDVVVVVVSDDDDRGRDEAELDESEQDSFQLVRVVERGAAPDAPTASFCGQVYRRTGDAGAAAVPYELSTEIVSVAVDAVVDVVSSQQTSDGTTELEIPQHAYELYFAKAYEYYVQANEV